MLTEDALRSMSLIKSLSDELSVLDEIVAALEHNKEEELRKFATQAELGILRDVLTQIQADNSIEKILDVLYDLK